MASISSNDSLKQAHTYKGGGRKINVSGEGGGEGRGGIVAIVVLELEIMIRLATYL